MVNATRTMTALPGRRVPMRNRAISQAHALVSSPRNSLDPGETTVVRTDTLTRPWGGGVKPRGMVRTELLTGPRGDYCGKSRDSPDPGGEGGRGFCGKNRHSKDKGDPAVTLPDSGGLCAHSGNVL